MKTQAHKNPSTAELNRRLKELEVTKAELQCEKLRKEIARYDADDDLLEFPDEADPGELREDNAEAYRRLKESIPFESPDPSTIVEEVEVQGENGYHTLSIKTADGLTHRFSGSAICSLAEGWMSENKDLAEIRQLLKAALTS